MRRDARLVMVAHAVLLASPGAALAGQPGATEPGPIEQGGPDPAAPTGSPPEELATPVPTSDSPALLDLQEQVRDLREQLRSTNQTIVARQPRVTFSSYIDFGFFVPIGNAGVGVVQDVGNSSTRFFPDKAGHYGWVFLGDQLATAINTRGEAADLGDLPGVNNDDPIHSHGALGFIVNEVNLTLRGAVAESALATASVNFTPRSGNNFSLGDSFDVDQAQLEWLIGAQRRTSIFVGKFDSVLGIEYRERKSNQRFGITPSLIARYTTGTPLGIKVRSKWGLDDAWVLAAAVTNGSSGIEAFHFYDELDTNDGKTGSGRLSWRPPLPVPFEVGVSGEYGPQDHSRNSRTPLWFYGLDLQAILGPAVVKAQWLRGSADGETSTRYTDPNRPYGLRLNNGAYLEADLVHGRWGAWARAEFRDAAVWLGNPLLPEGADRLYLTKVWRGTIGARFAFTDRIVLKAEYLHNGEYGGLPSFTDDIFTSSLVLIH